MPWKCNDCGGEVSLDTPGCPTCGAVKTQWTMVADQTRTFTVARSKFKLKSGEGVEATAEPEPEPTVVDALEAIVLPRGIAQAWADEGLHPPSAYVLLVRLFPGKKTDLGVTLTVEYETQGVDDVELDPPDPPPDGKSFVDVPVLFVYGEGEGDLPTFEGIQVVDLSEEATFAPSLEAEALGRPPQQLPTRDPFSPIVWARLMDRCGYHPLPDVAWSVTLGDAGERSGTSDAEGVIRCTDRGLPLGHFLLTVEAEGAQPTTLSTLIAPEGPHDVLVRGVQPTAPEDEDDEDDDIAEAPARDEQDEEPELRPVVHSRLMDRLGRAPLANVKWRVTLGEAGERDGTSDAQGVIQVDEDGLPLGHFLVTVEADGAQPSTLSTLIEPEGPYDVLVRGVDPLAREEEALDDTDGDPEGGGPTGGLEDLEIDEDSIDELAELLE